jgi:hypothetical protein
MSSDTNPVTQDAADVSVCGCRGIQHCFFKHAEADVLRMVKFIAIKTHQLMNIATRDSKSVDHSHRAECSPTISVHILLQSPCPSRMVNCESSLDDFGYQINWLHTTNSRPNSLHA